MRYNILNTLARLSVVNICVSILLAGTGTVAHADVELLDSLSQDFQIIGARYQQVPTNVNPDSSYIIPIRYNFGASNPEQWLNVRLLGPGDVTYFEQDFTAYNYYGEELVLVVVPDWAVLWENASWNIEMYDYTGLVSEATAFDITQIQPPTDFGTVLAGVAVNPYWDGTYGSGIGCTKNEVDECGNEVVSSLIDRFFDWITGTGDQWTDAVTVLNPFSIGTDLQKISAGRLRAYKLYMGLEEGNNKTAHKTLGGVGAKQKMVISSGSGLNILDIALHGYTVNGIQQVMMHPPGWGSDGGDGKVFALGEFTLDPIMVNLGYKEITVEGSRFAVVPPNSDYALDFGSWYDSGSDDDYAEDDEDEVEERIDIDFSVEYDNIDNTITITHGITGTATWPLWGICSVNVEGGSSGQATYSASGDNIEAELVLAHGGTSVECELPPGHPCWHGEVEMNMGIIMKITYPDNCTVRFEFDLAVAAGAHGEFWAGAASQSEEICSTWSKQLGYWEYDVCDDPDVQDWMWVNFPELVDTMSYEDAIGYVLINY